MKIWRRGDIAIEHKVFLEANGIKHEPNYSLRYPNELQDYMFEVSEDNPAFSELMTRVDGYTYVATIFTNEERMNAEWCIIWGMHSIGALQPQGYGWYQQYYADQCPNCGSGWRQIAPFRIKKEPNLGKNQFCSFGSAFQLFCTPFILDRFKQLAISGFETRPLILNKENRPAETLKQLVVNTVAEPAIAEELVEHEYCKQTICPTCGRTWYIFYKRGMLPLRKAALNKDVDFQLTNEWFGSGANARREILVSQRVARLILENKWKGVELVPIKAV